MLTVLCHAVLLHALGAAVPLTLDPRQPAEVRFTVDSPLDEIVGVSDRVSGSATFDAASGIGSGKIAVDLTSFRTGISLRDADLRDQFFQADQYPQATLTIDKLDPAVAGLLLPGRSVQADGVGSLSLHGVARPVRVPLKLQAGSEGGRILLLANGTFEVHLSDFGIPRPKALFLKLGDHARVEIALSFIGPPADSSQPPPPPTAIPAPALFRPGVFVPVAHAPKGHKGKPRFEFAESTPEGQGERLLHDPTLGGPGNVMTCGSCHATDDEVASGIVTREGIVKPVPSLFDASRRPQFWQGLTHDVVQASEFCVKNFMLNPDGLTREHQAQLRAYLDKDSPDDAAPATDFAAILLTRRTGLSNPVQGDRKRGAKLLARYCESCHAVGSARPPLTPGLYEPDYLVRRVRWLRGKDDHQMPLFSLDRLPDAELRDIVTYLAGDESKRIFHRKHATASNP
ncbi:MAG TPA: YceI family protein [Myxococcales bacterium]|nr:YceI family protein [Myxococcales bacterium]